MNAMYFIALVAPHDINRQVLQWKEQMKEKFGCIAALKSPAHITLIPPFWMNQEKEDQLKNSLSVFSAHQSGFDIQINNFSCFRPKVIFIDVVKNSGLDNLHRNMLEHIHATGLISVEKEERPFHPHITIATRDLYKKAFHQAWAYFSRIPYKADWFAKEISLLRHNKMHWEVIAGFPFGSAS
jgi:2'-5' RNA ligase